MLLLIQLSWNDNAGTLADISQSSIFHSEEEDNSTAPNADVVFVHYVSSYWNAKCGAGQ